MPYTPEQMFDLVADIEAYPEFLPWCVGCRITDRKGDVIFGDLMVGFMAFRESFVSKVTLSRPDQVEVAYIDGPFRYLTNRWRFLPVEGGAKTNVDFFIDFEFRSRILEAVAAKFFNEAVMRMVNAFETRAQQIYG